MSTTPYSADPLRVRGDTDTGSFAKSLRLTLEENQGRAIVRAMGPAAVNQMVKGLINAQRDLAAQGKRLTYTHSYSSHTEGGVELTAIQTVCTVTDL